MSDIIATIDEALEDWSVSDDAMRWTPDSARVKPSARGPNLRLGSLDLTTATFQLDIQPFVTAMQHTADQLNEFFNTHAEAMRRLVKALTPPRPPRPPHQPAPLCIDGHEYRRRQRGRRGRP